MAASMDSGRSGGPAERKIEVAFETSAIDYGAAQLIREHLNN